MLSKIKLKLKDVYRKWFLIEPLRPADLDPKTRQMLFSLVQEGSSNALMLLYPGLQKQEAISCIISNRASQQLQQQKQESTKDTVGTEIHDNPLEKISLSEEEKEVLHTMQPQLISEILRIVARIYREGSGSLHQTFVDHLQSFSYVTNAYITRKNRGQNYE